ncbi:MAG: hypothetical protein ABIJ56_23615 [Pseudomonadota bacterium]
MKRIIAALCVLVFALSFASCRQTRPIPKYERQLVLKTNSPGYSAATYRKPANNTKTTTKRKG